MAYKDFLVRKTMSDKEKRSKQDLLHTRIAPVDFEQVKSVADLVDAFAGGSIQARNVGLCAGVFKKMLTDPERPTIMLGLAGPLIAAGLRKVIRDMVHNNMVDVIVSTGAVLYQDFYAALGGGHYYGSPNADDTELRELFINRIYDTYVDEELFAEYDSMIGRFAGTLEPRQYSSREFIGKLSETIDDEDSILVTARKKGVPIFCPAISDSSIGIGLTEHYYVSKKDGKTPITIDTIRDNYELTQIVVKSSGTAAFYGAGGVPKNYINDSIVMSYIFDQYTGGHKYALQVTTDSPHWGGLSGSTLAEAQSWGKVNKEANFAMAFVEPSVSLPLIYGHAYQNQFHKDRKKLALQWSGDVLQELKSYNNPYEALGMGQKKQVVFVEPDEASSFELKGIRIDQLLPKEACSQFSAYRVKMKPHQVKKTSYHKVGEELYYVLSGKGLAVLDGEKYVLSQGCFFRVPPKTPHQFITEDDSLDLLNFHSPPVFSDHDTYFED